MSKISSKNIKRLSVPQSPVVLAILDGWGYRKEKSDNAIKSASTPIMDSLWHAYPHTLISASGSDVGLPDGQMGNSCLLYTSPSPRDWTISRMPSSA